MDAARLRMIATDLNLTPAEMSAAMGVSRSTYYQYLSADRHVPRGGVAILGLLLAANRETRLQEALADIRQAIRVDEDEDPYRLHARRLRR